MARVVRSDVIDANPERDRHLPARSWATPAEEWGGICVNFEDEALEFHYEVILTDDDLAEMGLVRAVPFSEAELLAEAAEAEEADEDRVEMTRTVVTETFTIRLPSN